MIELMIGMYVSCTIDLAFRRGNDFVWQTDKAPCKVTDIVEEKTSGKTFVTVDCREQYRWLEDEKFFSTLIISEVLNGDRCDF
jgi:hypothetical protein